MVPLTRRCEHCGRRYSAPASHTGSHCARHAYGEYFARVVNRVIAGDFTAANRINKDYRACFAGSRSAEARYRRAAAFIAENEGQPAEALAHELVAFKIGNIIGRYFAALGISNYYHNAGNLPLARAWLWRAVDSSTWYRAQVSTGLLERLADIAEPDLDRWWAAFRDCLSRIKISEARLAVAPGGSSQDAVERLRSVRAEIGGYAIESRTIVP